MQTMINTTVVVFFLSIWWASIKVLHQCQKTTYLLTMRFSFHHTMLLKIQNKNLFFFYNSYHTFILLPSHSYLLPINSEWSMVMPKFFLQFTVDGQYLSWFVNSTDGWRQLFQKRRPIASYRRVTWVMSATC